MKPINANTELYDKVIDRAAMNRLYERRLNDKVALIIDGHEVDVQELLKSSNLTAKGRKDLMEELRLLTLRNYKEAFNVHSRSLLDLFVDQVSYAYQNIEVLYGKVWKTERPSVRLAEEVVLKRPLYGDKTLEIGWQNIGAYERKRIEASIRKGIAEGLSIDEMALKVRQGNVHNITRNQARALVVTSVTSVVNQADQSVYEANKKAIRGYQYVAVLDSRTTWICAHRDGKIFPIGDYVHLPPAHFNCRSTTVPVFKSWSDLAELENLSAIRRRNLEKLTDSQKAFYDGQTPLREPYNDWLLRQSEEVKLKHIGDWRKVELFNKQQITLDRFTTPEGVAIGINELKQLTDSEFTHASDVQRFANAKRKLDSLHLPATTPDDFFDNPTLVKNLEEYYKLQSKDLDGNLSLTNYRGLLLNTKRTQKRRVLTTPPREDQIKFNPITNRYEDARMYQPNPAVFNNALRLVDESVDLKDRDKKFIKDFSLDMATKIGMNETAVIIDNLRILFTRYRRNPEPWGNFKAVTQAQLKFDIMNISEAMETQLRKDSDILKKLLDSNYIDPVLGPVQLDELHDKFVDNVLAKNKWEDTEAPKLASKLRSTFDVTIAKSAPKVWMRLSDRDLQEFYLKFANRLCMSEGPDFDQLAVQLGRDLHNLANYNGNRREWFELGKAILESDRVNKYYKIETFGVQKRRMKSRMSGAYFGPKYDTTTYFIRITDPKIMDYAKLQRSIDLGMRVPVVNDKNRLYVREGYKTYFLDRGILGWEDTRIPITSTSSFSEFPTTFVDKEFADALNWASQTKYRIDGDYFDFIKKIMYFKDDKGKAEFYDNLNTYKKYISSRGDSYERIKAMEWLRKRNSAFSNNAFIDHRARIYDRGLISPQSGETFRPFLNTEVEKNFSKIDFVNLQDQLGSFLGGLNDHFEGNYNSLSFTGRQKIAAKWRPNLVKIGRHMLSGKPNDIRAILEDDMISYVDGEDLGKFFRLALEMAKIDNHLKGNYSPKALETLNSYKTGLALEQDASSSGAQIIALTTKNKQLAELSNVIPTEYKKRLYDEIAGKTFRDPKFKEINKKLGLTEKDLRKAAKAQNMVTFYGAGERTGALNVEGKLSKILGKDANTLVVKASDRDIVLNEISARAAMYERFDPETAEELRQLRQNVRDIFNKGADPGEEIMEQLWFLDPKTRDILEKMSMSYDRVVTPDDFKKVAMIMSEHLAEEVPILKDFTRYFGRLAQDYLAYAKPSNADFDWKSIGKIALRGNKEKGYILPDWASRILGLKRGEPVSEKLLKRFGFWVPNGTLSEVIYGVKSPEARRTGGKFLKVEIVTPALPTLENLAKGIYFQEKKLSEIELFYANKLPKAWTNVPWINFDGKIIEQNFTQSFEERLVYKNAQGEWMVNIVQIPQKTSSSWWEEMANKSGKINDIADLTKARTAYAVNGNHSNDAVLVKKFHLWGKKNKIPTSTIHDAFFTNTTDMLKARQALREIYAETLDKNVVKMTLDEMRARGLPKDIYEKYLEEAIEKGLIPVPGISKVGNKVLKNSDILTKEDILKELEFDFQKDYGWYGVG
jgi:SPP1 gp7 family putative phage head morphogenesis protein